MKSCLRRLIGLLIFGAGVGICGSASISNAAAWEATSSWDESHEAAYSAWVEKNWTQDVFKKGPLAGVETDCAEATYSMRALYAFENHLPFRISDGGHSTWGENTSAFDQIVAPEKRFRAFLDEVFRRTSTATLPRDTIPIAIARKSLRAGTIYVEPSVHSYQIVGVSRQGVPTLMSSTVPRKNRILFQTNAFPFYRPRSEDASDGYRAFRWPEELNKPVTQLSRANQEQYSIAGNVMQFAEQARERLALQDESLAERVDRELTNICYFTQERAFMVTNSFVKRLHMAPHCYVGGEKDDHSTTTRDRVLKDYFVTFRSLRSDPRWPALDESHKQRLMAVFVAGVELDRPDALCTVPLGTVSPSMLELHEVWSAIEGNRISSDPNVSILARWGLEAPVSMCK